MKAFFHHLQSWLEIYFWLPLMLLAIPAAGYFVYLNGQRPTIETLDWVPGLAARAVTCILIVIFVSVAKQQGGGLWLTRDETLRLRQQYRTEGVMAGLKTIVFAFIFAYVLLH